MEIAQSRITAQGQISLPAEVRKRLGVGPGSTLVWEEENGRISVRHSGSVTSSDIHKALFPDAPPPRKSLSDLKRGIRAYSREKHGRKSEGRKSQGPQSHARD